MDTPLNALPAPLLEGIQATPDAAEGPQPPRSDAEREEKREALLFWALQEIQRQRERISELEGAVRRLCASCGEDPAPLLVSSPKNSPTKAPEGPADVGVISGGMWVRGTPLWDGGSASGTEHDPRRRLLARASFHESSPARHAAGSLLQPQGSAGMSSPSISKLVRLTGRRNSIEEVLPFLQATTPTQAMMNARMLRAAEHIKRVYGGRPSSIQIGAGATDIPASQQAPQRQQQAAETSADDYADVELRLPAPLASDVKMRTTGQLDKLAKLTGRRTSLTQITSLLNAASPGQALENARCLYTAERLKKRYGDRPVMQAAHSPPPVPAEGAEVTRPRSQSSDHRSEGVPHARDSVRLRSATIDSADETKVAPRPPSHSPLQEAPVAVVEEEENHPSAKSQALEQCSSGGSSSARMNRAMTVESAESAGLRYQKQQQ